MRECSKCKVYKLNRCFYKRSDTYGFRSRCKECINKDNKTWHLNNKGKVNKRKNDYNKKNHNKVSKAKRNERYKKRYNITIEEYERMAKDQSNMCKICNKNTKLVVDHCHKSNKVRGLLCQGCNLGLGAFKDNYNNLNKAITYLMESVIE